MKCFSLIVTLQGGSVMTKDAATVVAVTAESPVLG